VQQGNLVTQEMVAQLEPGMDKAKVKYLMGTPLIVDVFHQDRWDYVFTMQRRGGDRDQRRVSLFFKNDKLDHIEGDVTAARGEIAATSTPSTTTVDVPGQEEGLMSKLKDKVPGDEKYKSKEATRTTTATTTTSGTTETVTTEATPLAAAAATDAGEFTVDNSGGAEAPGTEPADGNKQMAKTGPPPEERRREPLLPKFQSESDLESAILTDDAATRASAAEAAVGADSAGAAEGQPGKKTAAVVIPDDAPGAPKKGLFRRLLEKVGVGDNESGEYQSADTKYKDPSRPDQPPDTP